MIFFAKNKKIAAAVILIPLIVFIMFQIRRSKPALTTLVRRSDLVESVYGIGTVTANKNFNLKVAIPTNVKEIFVHEGDFVTKGSPLLLLEDTPTFKAPFSGTITAVYYKVGESVTPQSIILTLTDMKDRYLTISLEQQGAVRVEPGQHAKLSFEGLRDQVFDGKVDALFSRDGQFLVRVQSPSLPDKILPGMTMDVAIIVKRKPNTLVIPLRALSQGSVQRKTKSGFELIPVKIGLVDEDKVEILQSLLQEGDEVLLPKVNP